MKEKNNCGIVQDLLPNYIEKLTNNETENFVENHLNECEECKKIYENMKKELNININKVDKREVKYIKKYSNKMKVMKAILLIVVLIIIVAVSFSAVHIIKNRKIYFELEENAQNIAQTDNYHVEEYTYSGVGYAKKDIYVMGEKKFCKLQHFDSYNDRVVVMTLYYDGEKTLTFVETRKDNIVNKSYISSEESVWTGDPIELYKFHKEDRVFGIKQAFFTRIKEGKINGIDCYKIDYGESFSDWNKFELESVYKDKNSGLTVRACSGELLVDETKSFSGSSDYIYEIGTVTEKDFEIPNVSEYKLMENE